MLYYCTYRSSNYKSEKPINNILINYLIITSLTVVNVKGNTKGDEQ